MKTVLLDTNFILTCIRQKIDFIEEISFLGMKIAIPKQVIEEIKDLRFKDEAKIALKLLENLDYKKLNLGSRKVDDGIIAYASKNKQIIIATLDREIKNKTQNSKLVIRGKKKLEVI